MSRKTEYAVHSLDAFGDSQDIDIRERIAEAREAYRTDDSFATVFEKWVTWSDGRRLTSVVEAKGDREALISGGWIDDTD